MSAVSSLSETELSEAEQAVLQKHLTALKQFQALLLVRQEAMQDIINLALEARGLSPATHQVDIREGTIKAILKEPPKP